MSRYIDADALDRAFSKLRFNNDGELEHYGDRPNWYLWGSEVENLIADAPSIDLADYVPKDRVADRKERVMCDEHTRKFQCEYYTVYARPNSCFFCDNCNDIFYDYKSGYASPYMWLCDKGNDTEVGMMGKCQDFYEEAEQTEPQTDNGIGCSKCESRFWCMDRDMPHAVHCNNYGKITDEPQTDCSWK